MIRVMRNPVFCICDNKSIQIICTASVQLISAFVFASWLLQSLYFLHLKYQVPSDLLGLHSPVWSGLVRNPEDRLSRDEPHIKPFHEIYEPCYENTGFCICENKDADQLRSNCAADQRLCFRYMYSTIILLSKSEISSF